MSERVPPQPRPSRTRVALALGVAGLALAYVAATRTSAAPGRADRAPVETEEPAGIGVASDGSVETEGDHGRPHRAAPVVIRWARAVTTPTSTELTLEVVRRDWLDEPLSLAVEVPAGARLIEGPTSLEVPGGQSPSIRLRLEHERPPTDDLRVQLDVSSADRGLHAELVHRFGRPEPRTAAPAAGPELRIGGRIGGRTIAGGSPRPPASSR